MEKDALSLLILLVLATISSCVSGLPWDGTNVRKDKFGQIQSCRIPNSIALTFDDGPHINTPAVLQILKTNNIKATFFVVGRRVTIETAPILKQAYDDGHQIALHTENHRNMTALSAEDVRAELMEAERVVGTIIGKAPRYHRNPFGLTNELVQEISANEFGYTVVNWNLSSADAVTEDTKRREVALNHYKILEQMVDGQSFITLHHDTLKETAELLPDLIAYIRNVRPSLQFMTVSDCLGDREGAYISKRFKDVTPEELAVDSGSLPHKIGIDSALIAVIAALGGATCLLFVIRMSRCIFPKK
ncbi:hypothetical protein BKA69DRAFT_1082485 [Paraphysoderma sedebokerense]|nr:hypothetical protein BKA69DRAFT_1082485 [Paraphysoderma sedebokerense]